MFFDCIVIGGGAAGMTAAITAARRGVKVMVLEHMNMVGKKILSTGNGKCNLTNMVMDSGCFYSEDKEFVDKVLGRFTSGDTVEFFKSLGVYTRQINGYVYPATAQAATVRTAMENHLYYAGALYKCNVHIEKIHKQEDGSGYGIVCSDGEYTCRQLILATGLMAAPQTGSDGSGIALCRSLSLQVNEVLPSLCQLISGLSVCKIIGSVRNMGTAALFLDDKPCGRDTGEIQFTEYGLSGIPIFQLSHEAVKGLATQKKVEVIIDTASFITKEEIIDFIETAAVNYCGMNIVTLLSGLINNRLAMGICVLSGLPKEGIALRKLDKAHIHAIAGHIKVLTFPISGYKGFESAQVCQGGVAIRQINPETMECYDSKNLYVVGELLDVDGRCGGYNLQWAFSTGYIAGSSVTANK